MNNKGEASSSWLAFHRPNPEAKVRLFCFPYAGGGALSFRTWQDSKLLTPIEICPVELPGRGNRVNEMPITQLIPLVQSARDGLLPYLDFPFMFFGHSMGAMIAFELARLFRAEGRIGPRHLFVSACRAPQFAHTEPVTYDYPDKEFKEELRRLKGTPEVVLNQSELMQFMLPLLRADFTVTQTYQYQSDQALECGITVYGGLEDEEVSREYLDGWREHTSGLYKLRIFPGDHFFLSTSQTLLLRMLAQDLDQLFLTMETS